MEEQNQNEKEIPVVQLNTAPGEVNAEQPSQVEINPETNKPYTQNEIVLRMLENLCVEKNIQMRDIANSIAQSLQKQIKLQEKERDLFKSAKDGHLYKVEYKELLAREIKAQQVIDNHKYEMDKYNKQYVEAVVGNLVLTAKTPDQKELAEKVAEMSGYKIGDLLNANDTVINEKAKEFAQEMFEKYKAEHEFKIHERMKTALHDKIKQVFGEKGYSKFIEQ